MNTKLLAPITQQIRKNRNRSICADSGLQDNIINIKIVRNLD